MSKKVKRFLFFSLIFTFISNIFISPSQTLAQENNLQTTNKKEELVNVQLISITDFHGYLPALNDPSNGEIVSPDGPLKVGGAAYLATHVKNLQARHENSIFFSAGDDFSGWPFTIAAHHNEPTIELMNAIGLDFSVTGNHEFDTSVEFLTGHMIKGKCFGEKDVDSCFVDSTGSPFKGADYDILSANIRYEDSGKQVLKPYTIKNVKNQHGGTMKVGFIGLTTEETIKGSTSFQEGVLIADSLVETANKYAEELQKKGVETIVAVVHEGGTAQSSGSDFNGCVNPSGPVHEFAKEASPAIDAIVTGHWHAKFNCFINDPNGNPRPVVEAANHGKLLNEINLYIDPEKKDAVRELTTSTNHLVTRDVQPDPEIEKSVSYWDERGTERYAEPVAQLTGDITRTRNSNGESSMANLIADVHYETGRKANNPADFALTANSPLKGDLLYNKGANPADRDGQILFGEAWHAYGYQNPILVVTLTGQQIKQILEEQWTLKGDGTVTFNPIAVSENVHYSFSKNKPINEKINPENVIINGEPLDLNKSYRVAALAYMVIGADGYPTFKQYTDPERVMTDYWAFMEFLEEKQVIEPPELNRVTSLTE